MGLIKSTATQYPIFRVTGPLLGCDDVPKTLLELCLVHYFTPVHQVILKKTHWHASDLSKAKGRLTSPLISTRPDYGLLCHPTIAVSV